jgi:GT2 family glycosyltransferase
MLSALDLGLKPKRLNFPQTPYGLNMLIQRDRLRALGGFRPEIRFGGDETDLFLRMHEAGDEIRYAPGCMVTHCVTADRFSIRWLLGAAFRSGGYHAWLDLLNGRRFIGWRMISSGFVMVLLGRRGCVPVALAMHALRIAGYAKVRWRGVAP